MDSPETESPCTDNFGQHFSIEGSIIEFKIVQFSFKFVNERILVTQTWPSGIEIGYFFKAKMN